MESETLNLIILFSLVFIGMVLLSIWVFKTNSRNFGKIPHPPSKSAHKARKSLLYKDREDVRTSLYIATRDETDNIAMFFSADFGKFGTDEPVDEYEMTPDQILELLQEHGKKYQVE